MTAPLPRRFWAKVMTAAPDECWLWQGARSGPEGYGRIWDGVGRNVMAHRVSYELCTGEAVPSTVLVLHRCDTPLCVNPNHLFLGDHASNAEDMATKQRGTGVVTDPALELIQTLRGRGLSLRAIEAEMGVSRSTVQRVLRRGRATTRS